MKKWNRVLSGEAGHTSRLVLGFLIAAALRSATPLMPVALIERINCNLLLMFFKSMERFQEVKLMASWLVIKTT